MRFLRILRWLWLSMLVLSVAACISENVPSTSQEAATSTPQPTPTATPAPLALTVLHTNDVWGHYEPCG
ncbi:MAG TPA: hypothetical protein EYH31_07210 [Anaerolineae bacterium]|nr:hypothetical protein [Anaerolineae bacterium]